MLSAIFIISISNVSYFIMYIICVKKNRGGIFFTDCFNQNVQLTNLTSKN